MNEKMQFIAKNEEKKEERNLSKKVEKKSEKKEERNIFSLESIFTNIKKGIWGFIKDEIVDKKTGLTLEQHVTIRKSEIESRKAGQYFSSLIPKSLRKPEKKYVHEHIPSSINIIDGLRRDIAYGLQGSTENRKVKDLNVEYQSDVFTKNPEKGVMEEIIYERVTQEGGKNTIEQNINNIYTDFGNISESCIVVTNKTSAMKIDINQLLPQGYRITPSELVNYKLKLNNKKTEILENPIPQSLASYQGLRDADERLKGKKGLSDYAVRDESNTIVYGDLTKKGGFLKLFHEIAHAWQGIYYRREESTPRYSFENMHSWGLIYMHVFEKEKARHERRELSDKNFEVALKYTKEKLSENGIEFDEDNFLYHGQTLSKGEIVITGELKGLNHQYIIKSEKLESLVELYEKEERDAWAHAVKTIRHLKESGIDMEPSLKELKDYKGIIDPALESYQKSLENNIDIYSRAIRFFRRSKTVES